MHPELEALQSSYNQLVDDVEAGHVSSEEATRTLALMSAIDADGWQWSIDPSEGSFVRSRPGEPARVAHSSLFVDPRAGGRDESDRSTQARAEQAARSVGEAKRVPLVSRARESRGSQHSSRVRSQRNVGTDLSSWWRSKAQSTTATQRLRFFAIVGVGVVLIAATLTSVGVKGAPSSSSVVSTVPTTSTSTAESLGTVPSLEQMQSVLNALGVASRESAASVIVSPGTLAQLAGGVALYTGFASTGVTVVAGAGASSGSRVASNFTVVDNASKAILYTGHATWQVADGRWKLTNWPTLS